MADTPTYSGNDHKLYRSRVSTYWWLWQWHYMKFILRELSSLAVAYFVVITLLELRAVRNGPQAFGEFQEWLKTPPIIAASALGFLFVIFHTATWFNLAPRAMVVRVGGKRVPDLLIRVVNYSVWAALSGFLAWLILRV